MAGGCEGNVQNFQCARGRRMVGMVIGKGGVIAELLGTFSEELFVG